MKKTALFSFGATLLVPILALAQTFNPNYIDNVVDNGTKWLNTALTVVMVLMTLFFLISVFRYISEKDPGKLADKRKVMLNGMIGLFVALSVWGIIRIAGNILGTTYNSGPVQTVCPPGMTPFGATCR
jgi:hypothetical protein